MKSGDDQTCAAGNPLGISLGPVKGLCGDDEVIQTARNKVEDTTRIVRNPDA